MSLSMKNVAVIALAALTPASHASADIKPCVSGTVNLSFPDDKRVCKKPTGGWISKPCSIGTARPITAVDGDLADKYCVQIRESMGGQNTLDVCDMDGNNMTLPAGKTICRIPDEAKCDAYFNDTLTSVKNAGKKAGAAAGDLANKAKAGMVDTTVEEGAMSDSCNCVNSHHMMDDKSGSNYYCMLEPAAAATASSSSSSSSSSFLGKNLRHPSM